MLLKCVAISWNSWNSWYFWNAWNRKHWQHWAAPACFPHVSNKILNSNQIESEFQELLKRPLETLAISCYLLKYSWNVLLSLETLDTLEMLETLPRKTQLDQTQFTGPCSWSCRLWGCRLVEACDWRVSGAPRREDHSKGSCCPRFPSWWSCHFIRDSVHESKSCHEF